MSAPGKGGMTIWSPAVAFLVVGLVPLGAEVGGFLDLDIDL